MICKHLITLNNRTIQFFNARICNRVNTIEWSLPTMFLFHRVEKTNICSEIGIIPAMVAGCRESGMPQLKAKKEGNYSIIMGFIIVSSCRLNPCRNYLR